MWKRTWLVGGRGTPAHPRCHTCPYQDDCCPFGSCLSRGCSCSRPPGRHHTCPMCGWRRALHHSQWAARSNERGLRGRCGQPGGATASGRQGGQRSENGILLVQCLTTSHFPDTQTPLRSVSLQEVPSRAGTMSCRWPSTVVQCRSHGLLEMCT